MMLHGHDGIVCTPTLTKNLVDMKSYVETRRLFRTPLYGDMDFKTGTPWTGWMWNWVSKKGSWDLRPTLNQKETMILEVQGPSEYLTQPDREIRIACFFGSRFFFRPKTPRILIPALVSARGLAGWTHEHHEEHSQATDWSSRAWAAQMVFRGSYDPNSLDATYDNDSQSYRAIEFVESEPTSLFFSFVAFFFLWTAGRTRVILIPMMSSLIWSSQTRTWTCIWSWKLKGNPPNAIPLSKNNDD